MIGVKADFVSAPRHVTDEPGLFLRDLANDEDRAPNPELVEKIKNAECDVGISARHRAIGPVVFQIQAECERCAHPCTTSIQDLEYFDLKYWTHSSLGNNFIVQIRNK